MEAFSTRATAGFNVFIELSVVYVAPNIIADRLAATEPRKLRLAAVAVLEFVLRHPIRRLLLFASSESVRFTMRLRQSPTRWSICTTTAVAKLALRVPVFYAGASRRGGARAQHAGAFVKRYAFSQLHLPAVSHPF